MRNASRNSAKDFRASRVKNSPRFGLRMTGHNGRMKPLLRSSEYSQRGVSPFRSKGLPETTGKTGLVQEEKQSATQWRAVVVPGVACFHCSELILETPNSRGWYFRCWVFYRWRWLTHRIIRDQKAEELDAKFPRLLRTRSHALQGRVFGNIKKAQRYEIWLMDA